MPEKTYYAVFLKKFNNYFNRIIKGFQTLNEYLEAVGEGNYFIYDKPINYNPADNVSTELIMNDCPFDSDYVLILDGEGNIVARWFIMETVFTRSKQYRHTLRRDVIYDNIDNLMDSPIYVEKGWLSEADPFIFNSEGMSFNQIKKEEVLLKDSVKSKWLVGYIAKNAAPTDLTIQSKTEEITNYVSLEDIASDMGISSSVLADLINIDGTNTNPTYFTKKVTMRHAFSSSDIPVPFVYLTNFNLISNFNAGSWESANVVSYDHTLFKLNGSTILKTIAISVVAYQRRMEEAFSANASGLKLSMPTILNRPYYLGEEQLAILQKYDGKIIRYNNTYYKMSLASGGEISEDSGKAKYTTFGNFATAINQAASNLSGYATLHTDGEISLITNSEIIYIKMDLTSLETTIPSFRMKISSARKSVENQAFDMFAIPLDSIYLEGSGITDTYKTSNDILTNLLSDLSTKLDDKLYDLQLLPYCPLPNVTTLNGISYANLTEDEDFNFIEALNSIGTSGGDVTVDAYDDYVPGDPHPYKYVYAVQNPEWPNDGSKVISVNVAALPSEHEIFNITSTYRDTYQDIVITYEADELIPNDELIEFNVSLTYRGDFVVGIILWAKSNSFTAKINQSLSTTESLKIESECNKYRLCSPNYQGSFDFNLAKNGGKVDYFIADCTYRPYTPYIRIAPQFNLLYGSNFRDCRGLICSGDFSMPRFTSAWESYELNNKNYQNIFNREIQNLDFTQSVEETRQVLKGSFGVLGLGLAGATSGAKMGGMWGAIAGAAAGVAGSSAGFAIDTSILLAQHREERQLAIDKYNYQLGNIKALPYTLTKVGAFNINNKIWPFIEKYSCTDEEKEAFKEKLKYESMTVMRISKFADFWGIDEELHYFKGQLIRNEKIAEDNHIFEAIYNEIAKGVYI